MTTDAPAKPKPTGKKAEPMTPAEQQRRFAELCDELGTDDGQTLDRVSGKIVSAKARPEPQS